ncbi:MAG: type VI secretion system baseplate subunit TssK [Treponema sp.]|jgi:type VI secretion system ImpJ/VasE family protein|nr:type VI secretion system baseplate subunit TssK [Treponema sp.]
MRFEQFLHWNNGQFLQPHHFQYLQRVTASYNRLNRCFSLPYIDGLIDFELDAEALTGLRVVVKRFSAIMPDGLELSEPGNCILKPLDLAEALKSYPPELTVSIAVPHWSELEANLAGESQTEAKKIYLVKENSVRDENSGDNEITVITRKINARLITNLDDTADMQVLPILRLKIVAHESSVRVTVDEKYIPPYVLLSTDSSLFSMVYNLLADTRRCRDKVLNTLTSIRFKPENFSGIDAYNALMLRVLNLYENRLSRLLGPGRISPFGLYVELSSFLAELMGINPVNDIREIGEYIHYDSAPRFITVINDIRSFIAAEGGVAYNRLNFTPIDEGAYLYAALSMENIVQAGDIYLAIHTDTDDRTTAEALEQGDTFKLINPGAKNVRVRGIKLSELRYPPRFLPVLGRTQWFKLELSESSRVWNEMCREKGVVIDWAKDLFPNLEASLFITISGGA